MAFSTNRQNVRKTMQLEEVTPVRAIDTLYRNNTDDFLYFWAVLNLSTPALGDTIDLDATVNGLFINSYGIFNDPVGGMTLRVTFFAIVPPRMTYGVWSDAHGSTGVALLRHWIEGTQI